VSPQVRAAETQSGGGLSTGGLPDAEQRTALLAFLRARIQSQKL
jgi:hypothetical protein